MQRKKIALRYLKQVFEDKQWCVTSEAAVRAYVGDKDVNDIGVLTTKEAAKEVAKKTGNETLEWESHGDDLRAKEEVYFSFSIENIPVEVMAGSSEKESGKEVVKSTIDEDIIKDSKELDLFGEKVPVAPLEELIVRKAVIGRDKDKEDLKVLIQKGIDRSMLQECLDARDIDREQFFKILERRGFKVKKPA